MKSHRWQLVLGLSLVMLSALAYMAHFLIFRDAHHIFIYLVGDIAFVPVEVLLVTLILHRLLEHREKSERLEKLNMLIGVFYSEVGMKLIGSFSALDPGAGALKDELADMGEWDDRRFTRSIARIRGHAFEVDADTEALTELKGFLIANREFLVRLLENPNLLEHGPFTDLLMAVFHLTEEIERRADIAALPASDLDHIKGDIRRAYSLLMGQWLTYMRHLKGAYPYLFSLAVRTNPFDPEASVVVKGG